MTPSAISHYRARHRFAGALAQTLKAIYLKYGVGYRLSRFQIKPNEGDCWYQPTPMRRLREGAGAFSQDPELQQVFIEIVFAKRISREIVIDLDLETVGFVALARRLLPSCQFGGWARMTHWGHEEQVPMPGRTAVVGSESGPWLLIIGDLGF